MTYVITEPCSGCKDRGCVSVCPVDAIHEGEILFEGASYNQLFIDPEECIYCGLCADECPVNAIHAEDEVPGIWKHFIPVNAEFYRKKRTASKA